MNGFGAGARPVGQRWLGLVLAMALLLLGLGSTTPARAADGVANDVSAQVVKNLDIVERYQPPGQVLLWEALIATVTLDSRVITPDSASANAVDAGDWFQISFPAILTVPNTSLELKQDGVTLASCVATGATAEASGNIRCTFTAAAADKQFVQGALSLQYVHAELRQLRPRRRRPLPIVLPHAGASVGAGRADLREHRGGDRANRHHQPHLP